MSNARMSNVLLFVLPALIWGSTWYVIKFQLGVVPPLWSVVYRFLLGGLILVAYCVLRGVRMRFAVREHARILMQGVFLFGLNYWLVYIAEEELTSALVAVAFSTIIFFNIAFGTIFLHRKTERKVLLGAVLGLLGTVLLFYQDLQQLDYDQWPVFSIVVCILSVVSASLGNVTSAANQQVGIPVLQTNAYGMLYGAFMMSLIALVSGTAPAFEATSAYIGSLLYLSLFGSIAAFGSYLTLVGRMGADRAAYVLIVIPVIALLLSMALEDYAFRAFAMIGISLILVGNLIVLRK
ncbi:MAG: EamA family transporter [Bacteroidota bacterium]